MAKRIGNSTTQILVHFEWWICSVQTLTNPIWVYVYRILGLWENCMMHRIIMKKRRYSLMLQHHFAFLHDLRVLTTHLIFCSVSVCKYIKAFSNGNLCHHVSHSSFVWVWRFTLGQWKMRSCANPKPGDLVWLPLVTLLVETPTHNSCEKALNKTPFPLHPFFHCFSKIRYRLLALKPFL
jgi:hypothetical protein